MVNLNFPLTSESLSMNPITEDDIANFLIHTPDFFDRHAELLATVRLTSPHGQRAVSLQERQAEMLREKIRALELRQMEMMRHGTENEVLMERLHRWVKSLLLTTHAQDLPAKMAEGIAQEFVVPQTAIRIWQVAPAHQAEPFAQGVSESVKAYAQTLSGPYVGAPAGLEVVQWLAEPNAVQSLAILPLHALSNAEEPARVIGLLVLASPDPQRYHEGMGTTLLERITELASAALSHLG